jgi:methionine synthase II (cobalamin-independent)
MDEITKDITIEDLTSLIPESVKYLMDEGIRCIRCGEPIWGTLESAAQEKGFSKQDIERFVKEINALNKN